MKDHKYSQAERVDEHIRRMFLRLADRRKNGSEPLYKQKSEAHDKTAYKTDEEKAGEGDLRNLH